ncbi:MAG TPA: class I SAM-dependent methyltransferase [Steroidobacteraceae bacterium]|nr:class I SAM-dependent methyltransferase [Steroidobacteraceae bacterium]
MASVADHYRSLLAPVYAWMSGGLDAALARGEAEIETILPDLPRGSRAVDLGAGFGMHSIALARRGCPVLAIDTSSYLLEQLKGHAQALPITVVEDDLLGFQRHLDRGADVILCMGDTLTHLADRAAVLTLFTRAAESLRPGGAFITTLRDYSSALTGSARFIPVRSGADRILTCFLEYAADHVDIHDVLHERQGEVWQLRVSAYRKLRLHPQWLAASLKERGFCVRLEPGPGGMIRVIAARI